MVRPAEARKARAQKHIARLHLLLALKDEILRNRLSSVLATAPGDAPERVISAIVADAWDERQVIEDVQEEWARAEGREADVVPRGSVDFEEHVRALADLKRESVRAYRQAALDCPDAALRRRLFKLARREEEHIHILASVVEERRTAHLTPTASDEA